MTKTKRTKGQTMTYKTLHKTKDRATQTLLNFEVNSCASESQAVPAPIVTPLKYATNMYPTRFIQLVLQCEMGNVRMELRRCC